MAAVRLALAALVFTALMYVLAWRVLWDGPQGSDLTWHHQLTTWVATTFPAIPWWFRFDASGLPYREVYPTVPHWIAVALSRLTGFGLDQALQLVEFSVYPLSALGIFAFFDWRLRRPLAGLVAGVLYLLSPLPYAYLYEFGNYTNQVGQVLFMPALIALDAFFNRWRLGDRGWRFRLAGVSYLGLAAALGTITPEVFPAPVLAIPAFALAAEKGLRWRWLLQVTPVLMLAVGALEAFWILTSFDYLSTTSARSPRLTFNSANVTVFSPAQLFALFPIDASTDIGPRFSMSPAVSLPAIVGAAYALFSWRFRPYLVIAALGVLFSTQGWIYAPLQVFPFAQLFVNIASRPMPVLVEFCLPMLAGAGLVMLPRTLAEGLARHLHWPRLRSWGAAGTATSAGVALVALTTVAFAQWVAAPGHLAYGAYGGSSLMDLRDIWGMHQYSCPYAGYMGQDRPLCRYQQLNQNFDGAELESACLQPQPRLDVPICAAFGSGDQPAWDAGKDHLVSDTIAWCQGRDDPICRARYLPLAEQLNISRWRPLQVGCFLLTCEQLRQGRVALDSIFVPVPQRAELNSDAPGSLEMAFHDQTGGAQAETYNAPTPFSVGLFSYLEDSMLAVQGATVKSELAKIEGIDYVVLTDSQAAKVGADYQALGWTRISDSPAVFRNPQPTGLAEQWPGGNAVLVVGASQTSAADVYNSFFKQATSGALPVANAWLVRSRSAYVDDYSDAELASYGSLVLLGYRYHDRQTAWDRLDRYVQQGGHLFVETGWQYVDPDWDIGQAPAVLPVSQLHWDRLDAHAPVLVEGQADPGWGSFDYSGGWGASVSPSVRTGAETLVSVGGKIVAARWSRGRGTVVWSGMNLVSHAAFRQSPSETHFVASQLAWLNPGGVASQQDITPIWTSQDQAVVDLQPVAGPSLVMFKESAFPGWSVELQTPGGTRSLDFESSEMDYVLVRLDSVPAGSRLVFTFGPTPRIYVWWSISTLTLVAVLAWLLRPALIEAPVKAVRRRWWRLTEGFSSDE
ncbi:MAG TPA: hypothetical protein VGU71_19810 [Candidatus Dormibacteraeota bacterium]|nr:hypothetical protein [Candidatus Dormibacteraeota bacterium]